MIWNRALKQKIEDLERKIEALTTWINRLDRESKPKLVLTPTRKQFDWKSPRCKHVTARGAQCGLHTNDQSQCCAIHRRMLDGAHGSPDVA